MVPQNKSKFLKSSELCASLMQRFKWILRISFFIVSEPLYHREYFKNKPLF